MEQFAAPQLESTSTLSSPPDTAGKSAGEMTVKDAYECRICGYKAQDVKCLSQHLHAAHPVTSLSDPVRSEGCVTPEEERVGDVETPCLNGGLEKSVAKDKVSSVLFFVSIYRCA